MFSPASPEGRHSPAIRLGCRSLTAVAMARSPGASFGELPPIIAKRHRATTVAMSGPSAKDGRPVNRQVGKRQVGNREGGELEAHTDFAREMSYGDYLQLDRLLDLQRLVSKSHDELLFVTIH